MIRAIIAAGCLAAAAAPAQTAGLPPQGMGAAHHMMHMRPAGAPAPAAPAQPGQAAFGAIQEIVEMLAADPSTDWSKVNIDALRQHLVDMNNVTIEAKVMNVAIEGGIVFVLTGEGPVRDSIRRMTAAHAAAMNGAGGWRYEAAEIEDGATLTVRVPAKDIEKLRGLGVFGVLALGMHHQQHHLMIARGQAPHR